MMRMQSWPSLAIVLLTLSQAVAGLNFTLTGNCSDADRHNLAASSGDVAYYNATGTTRFTARAVAGGDDPWYYYLTLQDGSGGGGSSSRASYIHRWLAVPGAFLDSEQGRRTSVCMYTTRGYDTGPKNKQGNDTCDGVLSSKCMRAYSGDIHRRATDRCDALGHEVNEECHIASSRGTRMLSRERSCFVSSLSGVDVPEGYGVVALLGVGYGDDEDRATLEAYDKAVQQSIATFFTFVEHREQDNGVDMSRVLASQAVCAIPNVVQRDSRPVESGGEELLPPLVTALVAMVSSLVLALW